MLALGRFTKANHAPSHQIEVISSYRLEGGSNAAALPPSLLKGFPRFCISNRRELSPSPGVPGFGVRFCTITREFQYEITD